MKSSLFRTLRWAVMIAVGVVILGLATFYFFEDSIVFQTVKLKREYVFQFNYPFNEFYLKTPDGEQLNTLWFSPGPASMSNKDSSRGLVLYFHGNRGNLQRWGNVAPDFTSLGYDVVMIDYRGYGKSTGVPSEEGFYKDAELALEWAQQQKKFERLLIYGRSLGSAPASYLASKAHPDLLILETPFDELRGVVSPIIRPLADLVPMRSVFSNKEHLKATKVRTVIFHGTEDRIVPLSSALRLKPLLQDQQDFIIIEKGGHRNLRSFPLYKEKLREVLNWVTSH